ncbi:MAG: aminopeptidase P family protein [Lachnospiraceae bacterium]|nr:aminopeptidase P family protein [Lachnospiraceae bacterium]
MARKELLLLQEAMKKSGIDWYLIPTDDDHQSEYVGDYYKGRTWASGFTGSAGVLVAGQEEAYLFTDGRYYVQAAKELKGSGIELMKSGMPGVPTPSKFLVEKCEEGMTAGFDMRVVAKELGDIVKKGLEEKGAFLKDIALLDGIWTDRTPRSAKEVFVLDEKYAGESYESKITRLREEMKKLDACGHVIASLDDLAWLFNLRGGDVECSPMFLGFAYVTLEEAFLFLQNGVLNKEAEEYVKANQIQVLPYDSVYEFLGTRTEKKVMLDPERVNTKLAHSFAEETEMVEAANPTQLMKAIKNEVEIENLKKAHIKDGVAVTKLTYWVKKNCSTPDCEYTEIDASNYVDSLRLASDGCTDLSFPCISAYGPNGAMMHYSAKEEDCAVLKPGSFYLLDSGGQYLEGTTDITRTMVLGEVDAEAKRHFTAVARGMLNLQAARFLEGCKGVNLDILARMPMWELGIDYRCGTGHGVGYYLNVHEGPNSIRWKYGPGHHDCDLVPGMVTTDEPGIYLENKYGIRLENELLCVVEEENEYGRFLKFEPITFAPIDLDGIDPSYMNETEKMLLNSYHEQVYEVISPYLDEEEKAWLYEYTRPV